MADMDALRKLMEQVMSSGETGPQFLDRIGGPNRNLSISDLTKVWNNIISRLNDHAFVKLNAEDFARASNKYQTFMIAVNALVSGTDRETGSLLLAIMRAVHTRKVFTIRRDDLLTLFDPNRVYSDMTTRISDVNALFLLTLADKSSTAMDWRSFFPVLKITMPGTPVNIPFTQIPFRDWRRLNNKIRAAQDELHLFAINIHDQAANQWRVPGVERVYTTHDVVMVISKEGTSIFQAFAYDYSGGTVVSYGLHGWIKNGNARPRSEKEMLDWFRAFKSIENTAAHFDEKTNSAWATCCNIDWYKEISNSGPVKFTFGGPYIPLIRCVSLEITDPKHLLKFNWQLGDCHDKQFYQKMRAAGAKNQFTKFSDIVPGFGDLEN